MSDNVLADSRPLGVILRREGAEALDLEEVLDRHPKPVIWFYAICDKILHQDVRESEVVGFRIVLVGVEVTEYVRDVHEHILPVPAANIVEARIRNACLQKIVVHSARRAQLRRLPNAMLRFHRAHNVFKVDRNFGGKRNPSRKRKGV